MERTIALPHVPPARPLSLARVAGWPGLWSLVALSAAVRAVVGFRRQTPAYFPDEYMYSELGRSLASTGRPLVRGLDSGFPALLQPLLTAPAWLIDDVATAYHAIQVLNSLAVSLTAVPVYLLARRLGIGEGLSLLVVALSLLPPALLYAGWVISEPFAYPLVAAAMLLGVRALERPSARSGAAFLALAGLAGFTRVQLLVLPACFVAAVIVAGLRERRLRAALREQFLVLGALALAGMTLLVRGRLGLYADVLSLDLAPGGLPSRLGTQTLNLLYASGWVIVPAAALGLALALGRPRSRTELAFGSLGFSLVAALVVQASLWGDTHLMQERYTFYAVPVLATAFALLAGRGRPWPRAHALACGGLLLLAALVPLSGYVTHFGNRHSPLLFAVTYVQQLTGVAEGALVVAGVAGGLAVLTALAGLSARPALVIGALAVLAASGAGVAANIYDVRKNDAIRRAYLPADPSWVDEAQVGDVALVYAPGHYKDGLEQLFWNRSVRRVLLLPGAEPLDAFRASAVTLASDGRLLDGGVPVRMPLLVDSRAAAITLRGASIAGSSPAYDLWRPHGTPRLATAAVGWYADGWLGAGGTFTVWSPRVAGRVTFRVTGPPDAAASVLTITSPTGRRSLRVPAGASVPVEVKACARGPWQVTATSDSLVFGADRVLSVRSTRPVWTPDPSACR